MKNGIELAVKGRHDIPAGATGVIHTDTQISIPEDCVGIIAIRRKYGKLSVFNTSTILWSGFEGCPELHLANLGANTVEILSGENIAHVVLVQTVNLKSLW